MNREDITRMAQECQLIGMRPHLDGIYQESLELFFQSAYNAGAAAEREACSQLCDHLWESKAAGAYECATAIRKREEE